MTEDRIYSDDRLGDEPFRFDDTVARVFPDMLRRSIPGYTATLDAIGSLAARFVPANTRCYDLGCSLGAAMLAMRQGVRSSGVTIVGVDNSPAMIERCSDVLAADTATDGQTTDIELRLGDVLDTPIENASMVVLNYTLQFLDPDQRDTLMQRIHDGLVGGGVLLLSEKVLDEDSHMEQLLVDLHHEHKRRNDYSALEIARKRAALENVLVPETVSAHKARLASAGFDNTAVWLRHFNFVSIIAIRQ